MIEIKYSFGTSLYSSLPCLKGKNFSSPMYFQLVGNCSAFDRTARRRGRFGWCLYCRAVVQLCQACCVSQSQCYFVNHFFSCWCVQVCLLYQPLCEWTKLNGLSYCLDFHRIIGAGRDLWKSSPTTLLKQGQLEHVTQGHICSGFDCLQG